MSFPRYEHYKDSGVEWLGEVPEHWQVRRLDHSFRHIREKVSDKDFPALSVTKNGVVPQLETAAKTDDGDNRKLVRAGDFVINGRSDRNGSAGLSKLDGSVSLINIVLRPIDIDGQFIHFLLRSQPFQQEFYRNGKGIVADLWSTGYDEMRNILLATPTRVEQMKIAEFLNRETAKIDALIAEQRQLMELLKEKCQAVILSAITKGLNPDVTMKESGIDWLDEMPSHWNGSPLGYLIRFTSGGTPNKANERYWDGDIPWVSPKDMKVDEISDAEDHITELALNESGIRLIEPNQILVVVRGMILLHSFPVARNLVPVTINQDMKAIKCGGRLLPGFLQYLFMGIAKLLVSFAGESAHGTKKMETSILSALQIALPPVEEQEAISSWLSLKLADYDCLLDASTKAISLLEQRRSVIISAACTGQIDVRAYMAKPVINATQYSSGFAHQLLAAEILDRCNSQRMGRIKLQKLIHLCEYHGQVSEVQGDYSRKAAGPFDARAMAGISKNLKKQKWFEEVKEGERYVYRPLEKRGEHKKYLAHWQAEMPRIDEVLSLLGNFRTRECEIVSTLYAAWNDLLIDGGPTDDGAILHEASSAERWHKSKEQIAPERWKKALQWMKDKGLVPVGYGKHTRHTAVHIGIAPEVTHEPA